MNTGWIWCLIKEQVIYVLEHGVPFIKHLQFLAKDVSMGPPRYIEHPHHNPFYLSFYVCVNSLN